MRSTLASPPPPTSPARIVSLDQFRGYTVLGMFVVNFLGHFTVIPAILKHHNTYCSYADTIMPQFFFAAGFAYRLTYLRRTASMDRATLYGRFVKRSLGLILLGAVLYLFDAAWAVWSKTLAELPQFVTHALQRDLFQTLVHIGVTALWIMPVIGAGPVIRIAFATASAALHVGLSHWFYYQWVMTAPGIDGGPLGFLTWTVPMLAGSLGCDIILRSPRGAAARRLAAWGLGLMILGYGLSCLSLVTPPNVYAGGGLREVLVEPPLVPPTRPVNLWTMNQRAGSVSYLTFGAGLALALYALFVWVCDIRARQLGIFRTLGTNALAGYAIHIVLDQLIKPYTPRDASLAVALGSLAVFLALCYLAVRVLEKRGVFVRM